MAQGRNRRTKPAKGERNKQKLMVTRTGQVIPKPRIRKRKKR